MLAWRPAASKDGRVSTRTLVILRHAKAAHPQGLADPDRPLTPRGHADAAAAGAWLAHTNYIPDLVLCSPARRTKETWHGVALALSAAPTVRYDRALYTDTSHELLELLTTLDDDVATALMVGHNPVLSQLSALLDPAGADPDGLRTAGLAVHSFEGPWTAAEQAPLVASHTARAEA
jgi:phosphohistidine phosphatase